MKKIIRILFVLVLFVFGFLYVLFNPGLDISQKILKTIGLERLLTTETIETEYIINVPEVGLSFSYPVNLESMPVGAFQEYDGAEEKVWNKPLYVWWISGQKMIELIQKPYHIVDGIDDYSITLEQKNNLITNGTCPREERICTQKKVGDYDILYMYGKDLEFGYLNIHMFILAADSFIYIHDYYLYEAIKKIGQEDTVALNQKATELWLENEQIMYNEEYHLFSTSLVDQKMKNRTGALLEVTQYAQRLIDSMQYITGFELMWVVLTGSELTGSELTESIAIENVVTEDKFEEISFPKLDYINTEVDKYLLKNMITFELLCWADQTTCNNNQNIHNILSSIFSATGSSSFETDFLFTNTKYEGKAGTGSYQYSIYIIPNIFGYKTLQEAKKIRDSLGREQDPYIILQVTPKYIMFDRSCYRQEERQREEGTVIEWCQEIEKNIIKKIQLK